MDSIITSLLQQPSIKSELKDYKYVQYNDIDSIPLGSHIKFIDRDENVKSGGFLININIKKDRPKSYITLKSNIIYKLYVYYYWIFYKPIKHETKLIKTIKKSGLLEKLGPINDIKNKESKKEEYSDDEEKTTMNIVIKSKPETSKKSSNKKNSKSDVFRALLDSLDKMKK